ncbi:hypothetical protein, partial [Acinetobacter baumannii]|uniref:hypothetical protein n=1 Tax=Acinetobacter baumannii TaxID=470 RepID=UPI001897EC5E
TKDNDSMLGSDGKATTLEIGGAGLNAYGFEFGNLTGLNSATRMARIRLNGLVTVSRWILC